MVELCLIQIYQAMHGCMFDMTSCKDIKWRKGDKYYNLRPENAASSHDYFEEASKLPESVVTSVSGLFKFMWIAESMPTLMY